MTTSTVIAWRRLPFSSPYCKSIRSPTIGRRCLRAVDSRQCCLVFSSAICGKHLQGANAWQAVGTDFSQMKLFQRLFTGAELHRPPAACGDSCRCAINSLDLETCTRGAVQVAFMHPRS